jgi:HEAT repeats
MTLAEAAARAEDLAAQGAERELADLRKQWDEEVEAAARSADYRVRAQAYRAIGQFRFKQKLELLKRGLEDESPACRGSALISLELLSRDNPGTANKERSLLHHMVAADSNNAIRRLAVVCLKNGSPQADTIVLLEGVAADDEADPDLRQSARKVAEQLRRRAKAR